VDRARAVPQIAETQAYVVNVIDCFLALTAGRSVRSVRDCRAGPTALEPAPLLCSLRKLETPRHDRPVLQA
jgi:hypothetical protein